MKQSSEIYDKDYFEQGIQKGVSLYENYHWLPDLTIPMAKAIANYAKIMPNSSILDVGCAKGYMVRAFRELGFNALGIDASLYAINHLDETVQKGYTRIFLVYRMQIWPFRDNEFDWVITKDTLEHLTERELNFVLHESSRVASKAFHIIPMGDGESYSCKDYEKDITHKLRRPMEWWVDIFQKNGFRVIKKSYRVKGIKDKWYKIHHKGNGFFILERRNQ